MTLPPGQYAVEGFPRFGSHLHAPPPRVPADPAIEIGGPAVTGTYSVPLAGLAALPRRELETDFHCVAGWSATGLRWEGVPFAAFYRERVEPALRPDAAVTHLALRGLDGYRVVVTLEDALGEDVLLAENLDGRPLGGDHGAPVRFVSPSQYGFVNLKHLCRIELHTSLPPEGYGNVTPLVELVLRAPFRPHQRARVWKEERHRNLPSWLVRPMYRLSTPPIMALSNRGRRRDAGA